MNERELQGRQEEGAGWLRESVKDGSRRCLSEQKKRLHLISIMVEGVFYQPLLLLLASVSSNGAPPAFGPELRLPLRRTHPSTTDMARTKVAVLRMSRTALRHPSSSSLGRVRSYRLAPRHPTDLPHKPQATANDDGVHGGSV